MTNNNNRYDEFRVWAHISHFSNSGTPDNIDAFSNGEPEQLNRTFTTESEAQALMDKLVVFASEPGFTIHCPKCDWTATVHQDLGELDRKVYNSKTNWYCPHCGSSAAMQEKP